MQSSYDPRTDRIRLRLGASPYELAHERAHQHQRREGTRIWHLDQAARGLPYVCRLTRLLVEWEAARLATRTLAACGLLDRHARADARRGIRSYLRALLLPLPPINL